MKQIYQHISHGFGPLYNSESQILILGSFPSSKSREQAFYYGHPQNRFWKVISIVLNDEMPISIEDKKNLMLKNGIALWDVIEECDIIGSSDTSIKNVIPTDIPKLLKKTKINRIYCLGKTAYKYYMKYNYPLINIEAICLNSTSPANCSKTIEELVKEYQTIIDE